MHECVCKESGEAVNRQEAVSASGVRDQCERRGCLEEEEEGYGERESESMHCQRLHKQQRGGGVFLSVKTAVRGTRI